MALELYSSEPGDYGTNTFGRLSAPLSVRNEEIPENNSDNP